MDVIPPAFFCVAEGSPTWFFGMQDCRKRLASVGWISSCTVIYHSAVLHLYFELMTSKTVACLKYWFVWLVCNGRILRQSYEIHLT
jgi:hypothetical protein